MFTETMVTSLTRHIRLQVQDGLNVDILASIHIRIS